ncbi:unnamed protein product [Phaedon cochleariae]|uniref:PH domain-containing protein n=1 Tax=Phaedon cochleariae TaxID=80249 RepID=A0A9N9SMN3_PHACE|nr:unnamed protein product [Phaedon cochleariae]
MSTRNRTGSGTGQLLGQIDDNIVDMICISSYNIDSANFEEDSKFIRDKSASCNVGLDLSPRPTTVIGLSHSSSTHRKNSKKESVKKRVIFQEECDSLRRDRETNLSEEKSVSVTSLASLNNENITYIDEGRELTDRTSMALGWKKEIVEEIIDTIKMKAVVEEKTEMGVPELGRSDKKTEPLAKPRVLPRAQFKKPPEIPQKPEGGKIRPAVPPRSATTKLRGRLDKSHSTPAYDLSEDGSDAIETPPTTPAADSPKGVGRGAEIEPEPPATGPANAPLARKEEDHMDAPPGEPRKLDVPPKPPPRNVADLAPKPAYPIDSPKPSKEAPHVKPAFLFPDVVKTEEENGDTEGEELSRAFEPKLASTPVTKGRTDFEGEAVLPKSVPSYEIQRGGSESKVSPTNSISAIECKGACNKWYHLKCSRLETKDFDEFSKELKKPNGRRWKCHECCEPVQNSKNDNSGKNLEYLTGIVLELQRTIEFMAANYDDVKKENKEIITLLKEIKKERNLLAEENKILKKEITDIKHEISSLKQKIDIKEQIELKNNIEIKGIPEQQDIDDEEIIQKVFFKIGIQKESKEVVYHTGTVFYFSADDADALQSWIDLIRSATLLNEPSKTGDARLYSETDDSDDEDDDNKKEEN